MRRMLGLSWVTCGLLLLSLTSTTPAYARQYHGHGHGHAHFYYGFAYGGWYAPWSFYYGPYFGAYWYPYYRSPVFYPAYGWYGMTPSDTASSIKVEVTPKDAKVYVDGYFAGIVDDFDGTFQRLRVSPGKHDVVLFAEGYHLLKQTMYLSPNNTYKIKGELTKLGPGDPPEQAPTPPPMPQPSAQARQLADPFGEPPPQGVPPPPPHGQVPQAPPDQRAIEMRGPSPDSRFGRLAIRVQPQGAEVFIDGERWLAPDTADRLVVNVAEGRHHIEVHKTGFDSFSTEVDVRRGETSPINVSLPPRGQ